MKRLSQSQEDYLEALYLLSKSKKTVRIKDLAQKLNVRSPSVIGALNRLQALNLVDYEHHSHVALTSEGEKKAKIIYHRHLLLTSFLRDFLQVSPETAEADACRARLTELGWTIKDGKDGYEVSKA
ncbi:MAG TPA: metal-dependent transcriptional regulator [Verrucomicrobiales bacterium]|nr:metal-dependent transcriptional regulator [Verrucomicrobiales bacterium]